MDELREKAAYLEQHGVVHVLDTDATIVKKDLATDDLFWTSLKLAAYTLEDVPDRFKDWHPGSDELVLDLLHPSLFPLQYGKTRVLTDRTVPLETCAEYIGKGEVCPVPEALASDQTYSRSVSWDNEAGMKAWGSYQWLPSDVTFKADGKANIDGYINNLHPKEHSELYKVLEVAVDKAIPLWNECLSWFHDRIRIVPTDEIGYNCYEAPTYPGYPEDDPDEYADVPEWERPDEHELDWERKAHYENWLRDNPTERLLVHPSAGNYVTFDERAETAGVRRIDLCSKYPDGLQVIFKLANIHLTPEKPQYKGSNWHVEGCLNEHIAATALFYYDSDNITDTFLEFRQHVDAEEMVMKPLQGEWDAVEDMYGVNNEGSAVQKLGKVLTRRGRLLAFPNVLQHKVGDFELQDATKPGTRKILAMFLVDPHIRILSTGNVPPQRLDWWATEVRKVPRFATLPIELFDHIMQFVEDFPISWHTACDVREKLMEERGRVTDTYNQMLEEVSRSCHGIS